MDVYTFGGAKVCHMRSLYDPVDAAEQFGLLPPAAPRLRLAPRPQATIGNPSTTHRRPLSQPTSAGDSSVSTGTARSSLGADILRQKS